MSNSKLGDLFFEVGYKINPKGLEKAEKNLKKVRIQANKGTEGIDLFGNGLSSLVGKAAGIFSIGYAFKKTADYIMDATTAYSQFDDSLRKTTSKLGLDESGLKVLAESTKKVALEFHSTAKEVSDAQEFLALAGYTLEEIQAASPTVVAAQKATGESMQLVSDIATDTGSAYGFLANQLDFVTDRMVYTTTQFNTNFAQLGEAMKYVAPIAKQVGMNFSDLNAYIGVLANSGIKGSQAGTSLRMAFLRLQAPTKSAEKLLKKYNVRLYDSKGKFIGINNAMYRVEKATKKMTAQQKAFFLQQLFGTEAMSAINILFDEGTKKIVEYGDAIDVSDGKTKEMQQTMENGLGGMVRKLKSEKDSLKLTLGEIWEPVAYDVVDIITVGVDSIRVALNEDLGKWQSVAMGLFEVVKAGGKIVDEIIGALNAGTFYIFEDAAEMVTDFLADLGKEEVELQKIKRKRIELYGDKKLIDMSPDKQQEYFDKMYPSWGIQLEEKLNLLNLDKKNLRDYLKQYSKNLPNDFLISNFNNPEPKFFTRPSPINFNLTINGDIATSTVGIEELSKTMEEKFADMINKNWDSRLKFESSLIGGNQ